MDVAGLRQYLRASAVEDVLLGELLDGATLLATRETGRLFSPTTGVTEEFIITTSRSALPLQCHPMTAINEVLYEKVVVDATKYEIVEGRLIRIDRVAWSAGTFKVTYTAGYDDNVPADLTLAVYRIAGMLYEDPTKEIDSLGLGQWALH